MPIPMRIAKYPPIGGNGMDLHQALPPSLPPPPPAPPNPDKIPMNVYLVTISVPVSAMLTGKWTAMISTEGMGDILWQYDWGPLQVHFAAGPAMMTPSMATLVLGSSVKYFLPSFSVVEKAAGGPAAAGSSVPVAVCTPAGNIPTEDCQDSSGIGFNLPSSICIQAVSQRWVGFGFLDGFAGVLGVVADSVSNAARSKFAKTVIPDSALGSGLAGSLFRGLLRSGAKRGLSVLASLGSWGPADLVAGGASLTAGEFAGGPYAVAAGASSLINGAANWVGEEGAPNDKLPPEYANKSTANAGTSNAGSPQGTPPGTGTASGSSHQGSAPASPPGPAGQSTSDSPQTAGDGDTSPDAGAPGGTAEP